MDSRVQPCRFAQISSSTDMTAIDATASSSGWVLSLAMTFMRAEQLVQELFRIPEMSCRSFLDHCLEAVFEVPHVGGQSGGELA